MEGEKIEVLLKTGGLPEEEPDHCYGGWAALEALQQPESPLSKKNYKQAAPPGERPGAVDNSIDELIVNRKKWNYTTSGNCG